MNSKTNKLTFSGLMTAITVILLFIEAMVPAGKLGFYVLASFIGAIVIIECNVWYYFGYYIASSVLILVLSPDKLAAVPFIIFFGLYAIIKSKVEGLNRIPIEYVIKFTFFNIILVLSFTLLKAFVPFQIGNNIPIIIILILSQIAFFGYDYLFTMFINFYFSRLKRR